MTGREIGVWLKRVRPTPLLVLAISSLIILSAFLAKGGLQVEGTSYLEVILLLGGTGLVAAALLLTTGKGKQPIYGGWTLLGFAVLAVFTALSVAWSVAPNEAWLETNRTFAYLAVLAGGIALARLAPRRWAALLHGIAIACTCICASALLSKIFPESLATNELYARLRDPLQYWNAVGLMAALGIPPLLWLAARRNGHAVLNAIAWPGIGLMLICVFLAYSRGVLVALAAGLILWFLIVPLRLRSFVAFSCAAIASTPVILWVFSNYALVSDRVELPARAVVGRDLGVLVLATVVILLFVGLIVNFWTALVKPKRPLRQLAGQALCGGLTALVLSGVVVVETTPGGISGQVWSAWKGITSADAPTPANSPDRLMSASSVRAQYWREAYSIYSSDKAKATGAGGFATARARYRGEHAAVRHAHGYVAQTMADLGLVGLGITISLLLLWLITAVRVTGLRPRDRGLGWDAERVGAITLIITVVVFGIHSFLDWTWFVPANAIVALLAAGWVAGRGPLRARIERAAEQVKPQAPGQGTSSVADHATALIPLSAPTLVHNIPQANQNGVPQASGVPQANQSGVSRANQSGVSRANQNLIRRLQVLAQTRGASLSAAFLVVAVGATAAWATLQPVRSLHAKGDAIKHQEAGALETAGADVKRSIKRNPLAVEPLWQLSAIEYARGNSQSAESALERATKVQPSNPETWRRLGRYRLSIMNNPPKALKAFQMSYHLDPRNPRSTSDLLETKRLIT